MEKLNIGITIHLDYTDTIKGSIWSCGNRQTIFYLKRTLEQTGHNVFLVEASARQIKDEEALFKDEKVYRVKDIGAQLDIIVLHGTELLVQDAENLHKLGCKIIKMQGGNSYVFLMEAILFKEAGGALDNTTATRDDLIDEIWTIPQHENTCYHYFELVHRCPVTVIPHLWNPIFLDDAAKILEKGRPYKIEYANTGKKEKRISIFEPNLNVVKNAIMPMLIVEKLYREKPELIDRLYITNAFKIREHNRFLEFALPLDIVKDKKAWFEKRYPIAYWLGRRTDVCVIHQWENAMNNMYLDALHFNYPLVHNSHFWKDYGYYYEGFNVADGAEALKRAIETHDDNLEEYKKKSQELIWKHHTDNPDNIEFMKDVLSKYSPKENRNEIADLLKKRDEENKSTSKNKGSNITPKKKKRKKK